MEIIVEYNKLEWRSLFGNRINASINRHPMNNKIAADYVIEFHIGSEIFIIDDYDQLDFIKKLYSELQNVTFILEYYDRRKTLFYHNIKELKYHSVLEPAFYQKRIETDKSYSLQDNFYCVNGDEYSKTDFYEQPEVKREILKDDRKKKIHQAFDSDIEKNLEQFVDINQGGVPEQFTGL